MEKRIILIVVAIMAATTSFAQSEGGLLLSAGADKKFTKNFSVGIEGDFRTRNDFKTVDRWSVGVGAKYKITKWLKVDGGYNFLYSNNREKISYHTDGSYNNWRPSYWGAKHRFYASLTGDYKVGLIHFALRERWQYTYRPEKTVDRWDFDNSQWTDKVRSAKGKNQLRSRFQAQYDKKDAMFKPYASVELYNSWGIEKIRYQVGTDIKLNKQNSLEVFYRFQDMKNVDEDDYDPDMHYLGIGYSYKF